MIIKKFNGCNGYVEIPLMKKGESFTAKIVKDGVEVNNLDTQPLLKWEVFEKTIELLEASGGKAIKGDAMSKNSRLGEELLPINSVEGYIAYEVYKNSIGSSVFRRISPISAILAWVGLCENGRGYLKLKGSVS